MKKIAVCPGSYDPITKGHVALICRAAEIFGACEVVVMNNREKTYRYSLEERYQLCREAFLGEDRVTVCYSDGMLYEYLAERPDAVLVKGVRNEKDFLYEQGMASFNYEHCGVETLFLPAGEEYRFVSSTLVREKMDRNEDVSAFVPTM